MENQTFEILKKEIKNFVTWLVENGYEYAVQAGEDNEMLFKIAFLADDGSYNFDYYSFDELFEKYLNFIDDEKNQKEY
jgi:hypothetical protein